MLHNSIVYQSIKKIEDPCCKSLKQHIRIAWNLAIE